MSYFSNLLEHNKLNAKGEIRKNIIFSCEVDTLDINTNYFCADQTNMNQELTTRNFYDSAKVNLYAPGTDIIFGSSLYNSVNCQESQDFSEIFQNIWSVLAVDFEGIVGTFAVNYIVINSEYIESPIISNITTSSGVFGSCIGKEVYINQSPNNPTRILFEIIE
jgi:hypothetical protein